MMNEQLERENIKAMLDIDDEELDALCRLIVANHTAGVPVDIWLLIGSIEQPRSKQLLELMAGEGSP